MRNSAARNQPRQFFFTPHEPAVRQFFSKPMCAADMFPAGRRAVLPASGEQSRQNFTRAVVKSSATRVPHDKLRHSPAAVAIYPPERAAAILSAGAGALPRFFPRARPCFFSRHTSVMELCSKASPGFMCNSTSFPRALAGFSLCEPAAFGYSPCWRAVGVRHGPSLLFFFSLPSGARKAQCAQHASSCIS